MAYACYNEYFDINTGCYVCNSCHYITSRVYNLKIHFNSKKHKKMDDLIKISKISKTKTVEYNISHYIMNEPTYACICGKSYKHRQSLYKHRKSCSVDANTYIEKNGENYEMNIKYKNCDEIDELKKKIIALENTITQSSIKNDGLSQMCHVNNSIIKSSIANSIVNSNLTKNEIKIYLNEKCADAISIQDFINKLTITLDDLKNGKNNSTECIINILETNLKPLSITNRPIHYLEKDEWILNDNHEWKEDNGNTIVEKTHYKIQKECLNNYQKYSNDDTNSINPDDQLELIAFGTKTLTESENNKIKKRLVNKCKLVL
jgi:hypothetical protein